MDTKDEHVVSVESGEKAVADGCVTSEHGHLEHKPVEHSAAPRRIKTSTLRGLVAAGVFVVVGVSLACATGTGTISSFGYNAVAAICPLGALESFFGSWSFVPRAFIALIGVGLIAYFTGKAFCSWICPVPHVQNLFKTKKRRAREQAERDHAAQVSLERYNENQSISHKTVKPDMRHAVLGGALASSAVFGFPVFCLICPVGLSFATFILLWRFVQFNEASWGIIVFPLIIILEVVVLRKWCGRICPMGALLSLISAKSKHFQPKVNHEMCLRDTHNASCKHCAEACPEEIDPVANLGDNSMSECLRCRSCADACPMKAITLPFRSK